MRGMLDAELPGAPQNFDPLAYQKSSAPGRIERVMERAAGQNTTPYGPTRPLMGVQYEDAAALKQRIADMQRGSMADLENSAATIQSRGLDEVFPSTAEAHGFAAANKPQPDIDMTGMLDDLVNRYPMGQGSRPRTTEFDTQRGAIENLTEDDIASLLDAIGWARR